MQNVQKGIIFSANNFNYRSICQFNFILPAIWAENRFIHQMVSFLMICRKTKKEIII